MKAQPRPFGFFSHMKDEELLNYFRENYRGKKISDLQSKDSAAYVHLLTRNILEKLVEEGTIVRKSTGSKGLFKRMNAEQLIEYIRKNHPGKTLSQLCHERVGVYYRVLELSLQDRLIEEGILIRNTSKHGFYSDKTNEEIIEYTKENFKGMYIKQLQRANNYFCGFLRKKGLLHELVGRGILKTKKRKYGSLVNLDDDALLNYIKLNYFGKRLSDLNNENCRAYELACEKGLIDLLVDKGILRREAKPKGFFRKMDDNVLIDYIEKNHKGKLMRKAEEDESSAIAIARIRGLIDKIVEKGILIREMRKPGFFKEMRDNELLSYITSRYTGKGIGDLAESDGKAYSEALKRNLVDSLVEDGVLSRKNIKTGLWKDGTYMVQRAKEVIDRASFEIFDNVEKFKQLAPRGMLYAINKYYGGFSAFRNWIKERLDLQQPSELEEMVVRYISGGENERQY